MQARVIVSGFDPINLRGFHERYMAGFFDHKAIQGPRRRIAVSELFFGAIERTMKSGIVEGFQ